MKTCHPIPANAFGDAPRIPRWLWGLALALVLAFAVVMGVILVRGPGLTVSVLNQRRAIISSVVLEYEGGPTAFEDIAAGTGDWARIDVQGETSLTLVFTNAGGEEERHELDIRLEPSYTGGILIRVRETEVTLEERLGTGFL